MSKYFIHDGQFLIQTGVAQDGMEPSPADGQILVLGELNPGIPPFIGAKFDVSTREWVDTRTPDDLWAVVRAQRNQLLAQSDWTQLPDVPPATKEAWATYRQALRDITAQPGYPLSVNWPTPPA
jgi:hypothetical protein